MKIIFDLILTSRLFLHYLALTSRMIDQIVGKKETNSTTAVMFNLFWLKKIRQNQRVCKRILSDGIRYKDVRRKGKVTNFSDCPEIANVIDK